MTDNIFTLSKREQRAAIAIVLALLIGTAVAHFRTLRTDVPKAPPPSASAPAVDEEQDTTR